MVPVQTLTLEENVGNDGEDDEGYAFLYHLELDQREGAAVVDKANTVGGYLTAVYSKKAIAQLKAITPAKGQWLLTPVCCSLRCPYHAIVIKILLNTKRSIVYIPFIVFLFAKVLKKLQKQSYWGRKVKKLVFIFFSLLSQPRSLKGSRASNVWDNGASAPCVPRNRCLARNWRGLA